MALETDQLEDIRRIAKLEPEAFERAVERLEQLGSRMLQANDIRGVLAAVLGDVAAAEAVTREALTALGWIRHGGMSISDVQESIRLGLKEHSNWSEVDDQKWNRVAKHFGALLALPSLRLAASAIDLVYEYTNLWRGGRILTDIRPIFNDEANVIDGAVVCHTLRLRFDSTMGSHELNIAMDNSDVEQLLMQCDRALLKAQTARDLMKDRANVPTMIAGESTDA